MAGPIYTVGHSTRSIEEFLEILRHYSIVRLVDIRTVPRSRRNPQFAQEELARSMPAHGIDYRHLRGLGGLRKPRKDSVNAGWRNDSFRGFADYMQTPEFADALEELIAAADRPTAIMCAEAVPWRCHRSLVADALLVRGIEVVEILSVTNSRPHQLTEWARVDGQEITYPSPDPTQLALDE
jgi:uncharacterized protein (DUF488 family)